MYNALRINPLDVRPIITRYFIKNKCMKYRHVSSYAVLLISIKYSRFNYNDVSLGLFYDTGLNNAVSFLKLSSLLS